ncbi:MAG: MarR family transcriptional regulator [Spirochaetes bacterium]|nr:MarR family transcriptional regulator [Spirochaetota bacterium]
MGKCAKHDSFEYLNSCLYFAAMTLSRAITQMAEEEFRATGLSPTYAFLVMVVNERQGISQKELAGILHLAPSTITRFIDKLERKRIVRRTGEGKVRRVYPTEAGMRMQEQIAGCWASLYERYSRILGKRNGEALTEQIDRAGLELERHL